MRRLLIIAALTAILSIEDCGSKIPDLTGDDIVTIGIFADEGASSVCYVAAERMFQWMGFETEPIYAVTINEGDISNIDVFYFPGGSSGAYDSLVNADGKQRLRDAITAGRGYIGTCAGAAFAARYLDICPVIVNSPVPGLEIEMSQVYLIKPHPITDDLPACFWIMYVHSPYFEPDSGAVIDTIGCYNISGLPALVACEYGMGRVFLTGPHPEWEENSDRDGVSSYDNFDDVESDWPLMKNGTRWCLHDLGELVEPEPVTKVQ